MRSMMDLRSERQAGPEVVPVDGHLVFPVKVVVHEDAGLGVTDVHLREPL